MAVIPVKFFVLTGACASPGLRPPCLEKLRCWRLLGSVALCCESARHCTDGLRWISVVAAARLMLATGTTVDKYLLVPFFASQAPSTTAIFVFWFGGHPRPWTDLLGLLTRFFWLYVFFATGERRLALATASLAIIATVPFQFMKLTRESRSGAILSSIIAAYLAFQHFTGAGGFRRAFRREAIFATLCVICMTIVTLMLVF
ncbi:hypothetical protein U9M48_018165 [Paspalum notatum var. saurae]|uniref:Glycosyltransferase RgtA/B/C/D-like domain-containing protein n=1 Tax=Paspalum notatum var. saurae TaxID=547442 RepID=A0AAQ3T9L5_PASNO